MPDARATDGANVSLPAGSPHYLWFAGILEGPRHDDENLRRITAELSGLSCCRAELDLDGGRFSILLVEDVVAGERMAEVDRGRFLALLQELVDHLPADADVESTLRCTEVYDDKTAESLFAPVGRQVRCVSRVREVTAEDRRRDPRLPADDPATARTSRRNLLVIGGLLLVVFGLLAWQRGLVDRVFASDAEQLVVQPGAFGDMIAVSVKSEWGSYKIELSRGPGYPATIADVTALKADATTPLDLATVNAVADGDPIYVRLEAEGDEVLGAVSVELRRLLAAEDAVVRTELPGRIAAHHLRLALDSGRDR